MRARFRALLAGVAETLAVECGVGTPHGAGEGDTELLLGICGVAASLMAWRTRAGSEVDFVLYGRDLFWAVKSSTPRASGGRTSGR